MLRNPRYVIAVQDLERSARYYRDVLGFEVRAIGDPAGGSSCGNMREFGIRTVDGHRIMFGCRVTA
jgi:catechol 2,3-dioxygenase-like lactoylglutathione lyase family enzyme